MALLLLATTSLLAVMLLLLMQLGRREGTDPHCRACGYNLTGLSSSCCPECGTMLTGKAVTQGSRRRRPFVLTFAVLLTGFSLTRWGVIAYRSAITVWGFWG